MQCQSGSSAAGGIDDVLCLLGGGAVPVAGAGAASSVPSRPDSRPASDAASMQFASSGPGPALGAAGNPFARARALPAQGGAAGVLATSSCRGGVTASPTAAPGRHAETCAAAAPGFVSLGPHQGAGMKCTGCGQLRHSASHPAAGLGSAAAVAPAVPEVHDAPEHPCQVSAESGGGGSSLLAVAEGSLCCQAVKGGAGQRAIPPLAPITNLAAAAAAHQQGFKLTEPGCCPEGLQPHGAFGSGSAGGLPPPGQSAGTPAARAPMQQHTAQQQAAPQEPPEWRTRVPPNKRQALPLGSTGSSRKGSGGKKKKPAPDASQLRISMFFSTAQH
jgi:hypothetical protein